MNVLTCEAARVSRNPASDNLPETLSWRAVEPELVSGGWIARKPVDETDAAERVSVRLVPCSYALSCPQVCPPVKLRDSDSAHLLACPGTPARAEDNRALKVRTLPRDTGLFVYSLRSIRR